MKTRTFPILTFLLLFILFFFLGRVFAPFFTRMGALFPASAPMSAKAAPRTKPLLSALPFALAPRPSSQELPSPTEPPASIKTYPAEPAVLANTLQIKNAAGYTFDTASLLAEPLSFQKNGPKVLIYHTHTSEAYVPTAQYSYTASDTYRTEDPTFNVCRAGDAISQVLESRGIGVIHETKSHDYPSYSGCYNRSLETVQEILAQNPTIEIVIDLHRDALSDANGGYMKTAAQLETGSAAQVLIIVGTDAGGLTHPDWQKNLSLGLKLQNTLCELYPGLARPLQLRTERFNGHVSQGALLLEIGACGNTLEEALLCADAVGDALATLIEKHTL